MNNFYATPIVGRDGSLNYGNIRQSGGLAGLRNTASWDWWLEDATLPGLRISSGRRAWTRPFSPQFFSPPLSVFFFNSLFLPWEHRRWSVITHHSTEEGFIMGLACWQDYCLDDKCSWLRALRGKLVAFFSLFLSTKTCPRCSRQRRSGANQEQLTQAVGEAAHLKQREGIHEK